MINSLSLLGILRGNSFELRPSHDGPSQPHLRYIILLCRALNHILMVVHPSDIHIKEAFVSI